MIKTILWGIILGTSVWAILGCQATTVRQRIEPEAIPEGIYRVTVHKSYAKSYAVLFDNPHDDKKVVMAHTWFTKEMGMDRPGAYLDRFRQRIRFYSTFRISEKDGTVRGYLVISNLLDHRVSNDLRRNKIMIQIIDPALQAREPD